MAELNGKTLEYSYDSTRLAGYFTSAGASLRPGVVIIHDAFGVGEFMKRRAEHVAALGYAVLAADIWGDGRELRDESEIGPAIGRFASDRKSWMGRVQAAVAALAAQPGVQPDNIAVIGYCFGGASALEYRRTIGGVKGVVSFHGGLDLVGTDWSATPDAGKVLILTGAQDPMAPLPKLLELQTAMTAAKVNWESDIYGGVVHGFTRPDSDRAGKPHLFGYHAQADARSFAALTAFLREIFA